MNKINKKGLVFVPYLAVALLGILAYALFAFNNQPPILEQDLGTLQAKILTNIGKAEAEQYYYDKLAEQVTTQTLYEISKTSGLGNLARKCDRGDGTPLYNKECNPNNVQKIFTELFTQNYNQELKKAGKETEFEYELVKEENEYYIIGKSKNQQTQYFQNSIESRPLPGKPLELPPTYKSCDENTPNYDCYNNYIATSAEKYGIDPLLIKSIIRWESSFNPNAQNGNAKGLMQLIDSQATKALQTKGDPAGEYCKEKGLDQRILQDPELLEGTQKIFNPEINIELGTCYYSYLYENFNHDIKQTTTAYHQGIGATKRDPEKEYNTAKKYVDNVLGTYYGAENQDLTAITTNSKIAKITGNAVKENDNLDTPKTVGTIYLDFSFKIKIPKGLDDYQKIYEKTYEKKECLLGESPTTCFNEEEYTWNVRMNEGYPLITVTTNTNDTLNIEKEPITIIYYADINWLKDNT